MKLFAVEMEIAYATFVLAETAEEATAEAVRLGVGRANTVVDEQAPVTTELTTLDDLPEHLRWHMPRRLKDDSETPICTVGEFLWRKGESLL